MNRQANVAESVARRRRPARCHLGRSSTPDEGPVCGRWVKERAKVERAARFDIGL